MLEMSFLQEQKKTFALSLSVILLFTGLFLTPSFSSLSFLISHMAPPALDISLALVEF